MKKIIALHLCLFLSNSMLYSQNLRKNLYLSAGVSFGDQASLASIQGNLFNNPGNNKTHFYSIRCGYFFNHKMAIGVEFGYRNYKSTLMHVFYDNSGFKQYYEVFRNEYTTIAPLLKTVVPVTRKFLFVLNFTLPYSQSRSSVKYSVPGSGGGWIGGGGFLFPGVSPKLTSNTYGFNLQPGFLGFVHRNIAIEGSLGAAGYSYSITKFPGMTVNGQPNGAKFSVRSQTVYFSLRTQFSLSVCFYLWNVH